VPRHQEIHGRRIMRWWLISSTDTIHVGPSPFRWDTRAEPTWIQVIFVCEPHQVRPTYISLWCPQFYWMRFMILPHHSATSSRNPKSSDHTLMTRIIHRHCSCGTQS
jgi:hypothetical protein